MTITVLKGDIFESRCKTLVNPVNCVGVMGAGLALKFKNRHPDMFRTYREMCDDGVFRIGFLASFYDIATDKNILMFPTKEHWRDFSRMEYIEKGLDTFVDEWEKIVVDAKWQKGVGEKLIQSDNTVRDTKQFLGGIAFPVLGAGLGGLDRGKVLGLMVQKLHEVDMPIEIRWQ